MAVARRFFSPLVIVCGLLLACGLFAATLVGANTLRPLPVVQPGGTAVLNIIPAPSPTVPLPTLPPSPTPTPTQPIPGLAPLAIGDYVQVAGTGSDGLRVRSEAGLNGNILYLAIESEVFKVEDGPREVDGYTWWYVVEPYKQAVKGWVVANYLAQIQNP